MGRFFRSGGWRFKKGGRVPENPVEVLEEFTPLPLTPFCVSLNINTLFWESQDLWEDKGNTSVEGQRDRKTERERDMLDIRAPFHTLDKSTPTVQSLVDLESQVPKPHYSRHRI